MPGCFFYEFFHPPMAMKGESAFTQIGIHPFLEAALWGGGMRYRTSPILRLPWMLFQLPASFPLVSPGCCEPSLLLSSVAGAQGGSRLGPEEPSSACPGSGALALPPLRR